MTYKISGVNSIIIYFGDTISEDIFKKVNSAYKLLKEKKLNGIRELVPSYTTLYIEFDIFTYNHEKIFKKINSLSLSDILPIETKNISLREIPVYYGVEVGLDIQRVVKYNNLSIDEVIKLHSEKIYTVYTIGFAPAFGYMGEVDEKIATPRLESPRKKIPKNSVALADKQTAIYPNQSPGGWNIIGRTYLNIFDKSYENFSYLRVGERVKFIPISKEEFLKKGGKL